MALEELLTSYINPRRAWVGDKERIFTTSNEALNEFVFATRLFQEVKDYIITSEHNKKQGGTM